MINWAITYSSPLTQLRHFLLANGGELSLHSGSKSYQQSALRKKNKTKFCYPVGVPLPNTTQLAAMPLTGQSAIILRGNKDKDCLPREQILPR